MAYYPLFFDFEHKPVLIIGAGHTALEKAKRLLVTGAEITVIAKEFLSEFDQYPTICKVKRVWKPSDLEDFFLIIAATNDPQENLNIAHNALNINRLCNVVDDAGLSSCIFGATVMKEKLSIGISTSGASPSAAQYLKKEIRSLLNEKTDHFDEILVWLANKRPVLLARYPAHVRHELFRDLFYACLEKGNCLDEQQFEQFLHQYDD